MCVCVREREIWSGEVKAVESVSALSGCLGSNGALS